MDFLQSHRHEDEQGNKTVKKRIIRLLEFSHRKGNDNDEKNCDDKRRFKNQDTKIMFRGDY